MHRDLHLSVHAVDEVLRGNTDPESAKVAAEGHLVIGYRHVRRCRIQRIMTGDNAEEYRRVPNILRHRSDLIQR